MKTPMQETLEQIERALDITISDQDKQCYIEKEKRVIINSNIAATKDVWTTIHSKLKGELLPFTAIDESKFEEEAEQYYNETFEL